MSQNNRVARTGRKPDGTVGLLQLDSQNRVVAALEGGAGSDAVSKFSANVANTAAVASLPAVVGATNSLSGFFISGAGATAAGLVEATITGLAGGTLSVAVPVPAGANVGLAPIFVNFHSPLPASGPDVAITLTLPALGAGNTNASVGVWGSVD